MREILKAAFLIMLHTKIDQIDYRLPDFFQKFFSLRLFVNLLLHLVKFHIFKRLKKAKGLG